jgi:hypothetical protein
MSNLYRGPSIDASYQVSVHLATWFQRRRFKKIDNQKQELPVVAMFVNGSGQNVQSLERTAHRCFLPSFGSFGQMVSEKNFKNQPIRNKCRLWRSCLSTDRDEMTNRYIGPSIDASYQVSVHLAKRFQRKRFKKSTNQKQELPVVAMFVNGSGQNVQSLERTAHRCFLPFSVHLAKRFQRRRI